MVKSILVTGGSGFIGSNLKKLYKPQFNYNSKNILKIKNKKFDLTLCAGTPSKRHIANKKPKKDLQNIKKLTGALKNIKTIFTNMPHSSCIQFSDKIFRNST